MAQVTSSDDDTDQGFIQHVAPMRLMYLSGHLHPALKIVEDVTKFLGCFSRVEPRFSTRSELWRGPPPSHEVLVAKYTRTLRAQGEHQERG